MPKKPLNKHNSNLAWPKCWKRSSKPHNFCPGCGHPIVLKMLGEIIDELKLQNNTLFGVDIGCSLLAWDFFNIDTVQTHHGRTVPVIVGAKKSRPDALAIAYVGDGGAYAIGAQHLVNSRMRNDNITTIVINNANYGMTGGQEAPTSIPGQITTTSVKGADEFYLKGPEMVSKISDVPAYVARASVDNPIQLKMFLKKALEWQLAGKGFSFVEVLSFCPTNWKTDARGTLAFLNKLKTIYPVGEINK